MSKKETYKRSFLKTFTWRIVASLDTALLTWLFSGDVLTGIKVGGMEIVTKLFIYFFHERAWRIGWNKQSDQFHHSKRNLYQKCYGSTKGILCFWNSLRTHQMYRSSLVIEHLRRLGQPVGFHCPSMRPCFHPSQKINFAQSTNVSIDVQ